MTRQTQGARRIAALTLATVLAVTGLALAEQPVPDPDPSSAPSAPGHVLVRFPAGTTDAQRTEVHARNGGAVLRRIPELNTDVVLVPAGVDGVRLYDRDPAVVYAEPNFRVRLAHSLNDPCISASCVTQSPGNEWNLTWINADYGWRAYPGKAYTAAERLALDPAKIVKVAVLDTKIDTSHEEWVNAGGAGPSTAQGGQLDLADSKDFDDPTKRIGSAAYHGTFVAGILGAAAGNALGIAGVGYLSQIMPVAVVDGTGLAEADKLASGIIWAWQHKARVINLSLGTEGDSQTVRDAIRMVTSGTSPSLVVAAAGNNTMDAPFYPGSYPEVMSVSGTDPTDRRAACSNYNSNVAVAAPADGLVSLKIGGGLIKGQCGTSAAAPQVSGLAAMLFAQNPARTPAQVRQIIERSADDRGPAGRDNFFGNGRINMERALRYTEAVAVTRNAAATIPLAAGGPSTITALATSSRPIQRAELFLDREDCNGSAGIALRAVDGAFGETSELLTVDHQVGPAFATGVHPMWIRTFDGTAWGPTTVGVLYVDRGRPVIMEDGHGGIVSRFGPALRSVEIHFTIRDDYSSSFIARVRIVTQDAITKKAETVHQELRTGVPLGLQSFRWEPEPTLKPGSYQVSVELADQGLNGSSKFIQSPLVVL